MEVESGYVEMQVLRMLGEALIGGKSHMELRAVINIRNKSDSNLTCPSYLHKRRIKRGYLAGNI